MYPLILEISPFAFLSDSNNQFTVDLTLFNFVFTVVFARRTVLPTASLTGILFAFDALSGRKVDGVG